MPEPNALIRRLRALTMEAQAFIPPGRPDQYVRQWLGRSRMAGADRAWDHARDLAVELCLITPSLMGVTALDRLARAMKGWPADDVAAAAMLRASRPMMLAVEASGTRDIASGQVVTLASDQPMGAVFGRFASLPDGRLIDVGPVLALGPDVLSLTQGLMRPNGKVSPISARIVEMIYRDIVWSGATDDPFDPDNDQIDRLAADWACLGRDPTAAEQARARSLASADTLVEAITRVSMASTLNRSTLASAYRWIAAVMVETLALRGANGSATGALDQVEQELRSRIDTHLLPPESLTLFTTLRSGVKRSSAPKAVAGDLDKLVARIQALRAKTVELGCTEQEAMAAAEKVAELLDRYGLSLSELDLRQQACEGIGVETGRKRRGPIDDCMGTIAHFFDCRVWAETNPDGTLRYVFFGMPADVQAAVYLHDLVALAFASETATFQAGAIYTRTASGDRRNATTSFQAGLARGINHKLRDLREQRDRAVTPNGTGRALVPVKESIIDEELARLGLTLRRRTSARRYVQREAYSAGQEAGARFEYRPGINAA